MSLLEITVVPGDHGPVVMLSGEADVTVVDRLAAALTAQVQARVRHLTVDLSELEYADSASISALVAAAQALQDSGGTVELARPRPVVARTLGLLGVHQVIPVHGAAVAEHGADDGGLRAD